MSWKELSKKNGEEHFRGERMLAKYVDNLQFGVLRLETIGRKVREY